jgi:hypothetical protein
LRYAGRLATDPLNTLGQGEAHLFDGTGSQSGTGNRWGDYSSLTVDPVDDSTFWYTNEYYAVNGTFNWRTRIGSFKVAVANPSPTPSPSPSATPTATPIATPSPTPTPTPTPAPNFSLSVNPTSVTVPRSGGTATYNVTIMRNGGFAADISFSVTGLPSGASANFNPSSTTGNSTTLRITVPGSSARGTYPLTVTGTSGTISHTASATLVKSKR